MVQIPNYGGQRQGIDPMALPETRVDNSIGEALGRVGNAIASVGGGIADKMRAEQEQLRQYKDNLALETFKNNTLQGFQTTVDNGAPDGSDILPSLGEPLQKQYEKIKSTFTDPVQRAKADLYFENLRGELTLKGQEAASQKASRFILATTNDSIQQEIKLGNLKTSEDVDTYFERVVKPRVDMALKDPIDRQKQYAALGEMMATDFIKRHPELAMPQKNGSQPTAPGASEGPRTDKQPAAGAPANVDAVFGKQLAFTIHELNGTERRAGAALKSASTLEDAVRAAVSYERPKDPTAAYQVRLRFAQQVLSGKATSRAMQAFSFYKSQGFTDIQAAGFVGNLMGESGPNLDTEAHGDKSIPGGSRGIGQWNRERLAAYNAFAGSAGAFSMATPDAGLAGNASTAYSMPQKPTGGVFDYLPDSAWNQITKAGMDSFKDSLDLGIEQGTTSRDDILNAPIDDGNKAVLVRRWDEKNAGKLSMADLAARIDSGGYIDPNDSNTRKAAGLMLDQSGGGQAIVAGDPGAVRSMIDIFRKTGIVPDNAKGAIQSMLNSGDTARINTALSYLGGMRNDNPRAFQKAFDADTEALVTSFLSKKDYATPEQVADGIRVATSPETENIRKDRAKEAQKVADKIVLNDVRDLFDPSILPFTEPDLTVAPDAEAQLMGDYRQLYVDAYKLTGDDAQAKKTAAEQLTRVWGASAANSGRIMKWPPEALLGPNAMVNGSYGWMGEQLSQALKDMGYSRTDQKMIAAGKAVVGVDQVVPLEHFLLADERTRSEAASGKLPSYQVWVKRENGQFDVVPRRFIFDPKPARDAYAPKFQADQARRMNERQNLDKALAMPPTITPTGPDPSVPAVPGGNLAPPDLNTLLEQQ